MEDCWRWASSCSAALALMGCSAATQAALVPQLDLGLRSARTQDSYFEHSSTRSKQRWDLTVFTRLSWTSRRSVALIPSRSDLTPDAWIDPCPDPDCFWDTPDDEPNATPEPAP